MSGAAPWRRARRKTRLLARLLEALECVFDRLLLPNGTQFVGEKQKSDGEVILVSEDRHFADVLAQPDPSRKIDPSPAIDELVLSLSKRLGRYRNRSSRRAKERAGF